MIPILFEHDETEFNNNGICRLADSISCIATEALNGAYECELQYPVTGRHFKDITDGRIIFTTHDDTHIPQPFEIYKKSASMNGVVTFNARHVSYRLSNVVLEPFSSGSIAGVMAVLNTHSINDNPFTFSTTVNGQTEFKLETPASCKSVLGGMEGSILDQYGGEYEWDRWAVKLHSKRGRDTSITLRYGKNITDIQYDLDSSSVFTAAVPYWRRSDGTLKMLPQKIVAFNAWDFDSDDDEYLKKAVALDFSSEFEEEPTNEALYELTKQALIEANIPKQNIKVNFFELWNTKEYEKFSSLQRVYLGDSVNIVYTDLGISTTLRAVKVVYDALLDRYNSIELGRLNASFGSTLKEAFQEVVKQYAPSKTAMEQAIDHATSLITGGTGGHFVIGLNADGKPNEAFWMDTDNVNTAVNVLRINYQGIGFSSTGVEGPYTTAWTLDGHFVADFITAGNLNATLLTVGIIADALRKNSWDLESGMLITTLALIGGLHVNATSVYSGDHNTLDSAEPGFYLGSDGTFSFGNDSQYIKFSLVQDEGSGSEFGSEVQDEFEHYKLEMRLDSLLIGPSQKPITDTTFTDIDNNITDAGRTATNYIYYSANDGVVVSQTGTATGSNEKPYNTQILDGGINFRKRDKNLASMTGDDLTFYRGTTGKKASQYGATDLVFYKPDGETEAAKFGANGLEVVAGVIGGFQADSTALQSYLKTPEGNEYTVIIRKLSSALTNIIEIKRKFPGNPEETVYSVRSDGKTIAHTAVEFGSGAHYLNIDAGSPGSSSMNIGSVNTDGTGTRFRNIQYTSVGNVARLYAASAGSYLDLYAESSSSKRYKDHVGEMTAEYARQILDIVPVLFRYKDGYLTSGDECEGKEIPGFYAEDVESHFPMGVYHNEDGSVENWKPERIIPAMLRVIQEQDTEIANLKKEVAEIKATLKE